MKPRFPASLLCLALLIGCGDFRPEAESAESLLAESRQRLSQLEGTIALEGLEQPVEVLRDNWGVPHIYAQLQRDLFFAQGFIAAQDRLYQIEIWRRTGAGELAEVFGEDYIERDRIARLVRYRGDMEAEWSSYSPDTQQIAEAFTAGVNAYIRHRGDDLPIEFELLDFRPGKWEPEHILLRIAGLLMTRNTSQEIARAELAAALGLEMTARYFPPDPAIPLDPDPALDLQGLDERVLADYRAATSIPRLEEEAQGSNNWVVGGSLSATGNPLLASDPHRPVILPSLRWLCHLNAPGWNVIGSGEPALPGVAIGHNERIGWGFTIVQFDQADLFIEELHPENPRQYRYGEEWLEMTVEREAIRVKGRGEPVEVDLKFTRHGPVIWEDHESQRAAALRWVGSEPGTAGYLGSLAVDRASNWEEFVEAMKAWKTPSENIIYGDVEGNIGWVAAGLMPIRKNWSGLFPVPGAAAKYDWAGFRTVEQLPQRFNPRQGFIATANQNIRPENYPYPLGYDWAPPYRFQRIHEVLSQGGPFSGEDFEKLQHDELSIPARQLIALLRDAGEPPSEAAAEGRRMLAEWDYVLDKRSGPAPLYEIWQQKLPAKFAESQVPPEQQALLQRRLPLPVIIGELEKATPALRRLVLWEALEEAAAEAEELLGTDREQWRWGKLHTITFEHPLAHTESRRQAFQLGPVERGGDGYTPNATSGPGYTQRSGASYRHVLDLGDWDRSVFTSTPGQSGQPGSPHYSDLLPKWAAHEYVPLLFSREAVEQQTAHRLLLEPARP